MVQQKQSNRRERRAPDWPAAAVSGFAAGALLMVLDLFWSSAITGGDPWATSRMIAAIVMGQQTLQSSTLSVDVVAVALAAHYALGVAFGILLVAVSAPLRLDATVGIAMLTGAVFGCSLYLVNFHGMVHFFPWFGEIRGWATLAAHLVFGMSSAILYWKLERRGEAGEAVQKAG
jgi:Na+/phosphate symporter